MSDWASFNDDSDTINMAKASANYHWMIVLWSNSDVKQFMQKKSNQKLLTCVPVIRFLSSSISGNPPYSKIPITDQKMVLETVFTIVIVVHYSIWRLAPCNRLYVWPRF
jgi:hypothetical protein